MSRYEREVALELQVLPLDVIQYFLFFAEHKDLCQWSEINKFFHDFILQNNRVWHVLCLKTWRDKYFIPQYCMKLIGYKAVVHPPTKVVPRPKLFDDEYDRDNALWDDQTEEDTKEEECLDISTLHKCDLNSAREDFERHTPTKTHGDKEAVARQAFRLAWCDRSRKWITRTEVSSILWNFRFKQDAGVHWTSMDPFWISQGKYSTQVHFQHDGEVKMYGNVHIPHAFRWRFVSQGKSYEGGSALRVEQFPKHLFARHPQHWGWLHQSCWVIECAFPLPAIDDVKENAIIEKDFVDIQMTEILSYNYTGAAMDSDDENEIGISMIPINAQPIPLDSGPEDDNTWQ